MEVGIPGTGPMIMSGLYHSRLAQLSQYTSYKGENAKARNRPYQILSTIATNIEKVFVITKGSIATLLKLSALVRGSRFGGMSSSIMLQK